MSAPTAPEAPAVRTVVEETAARFAAHTAEHTLVIRHDDGLYRHLVMRQPGCGFDWYEVVTWRGALTVRGDFGHAFTFAVLPDMFEAVRRSTSRGRLDPQYWVNRLDSGEAGARDYSGEKFRAAVARVLDDQAEAELLDRTHALAQDVTADGNDQDLTERQVAWCRAEAEAYMAGLRAAVEDEILGDDTEYNVDEWESEARRALAGFEYRPEGAPRGEEPFTFEYCEFDGDAFRDWSWEYLWALHALVQAVTAYDERTRPVDTLAVTGGAL